LIWKKSVKMAILGQDVWKKQKTRRFNHSMRRMDSAIRNRILLVIGTVVTIILLIGSAMAAVPSHRNFIHIEDPVDDEVEEDFDIVSLEGSSKSEELDIELRVRGEIQESGYIIRILAREPGGEVFDHELALEGHGNEGIHWEIEDDVLKVSFFLHAIEHGAYLVGLEAETLGDGGDLASEKTREALQVEHVVELPVDPIFLFIPGVILVAVLLIAFWKMD
jgi:hypothetical protein